jgi:hypothetical protein
MRAVGIAFSLVLMSFALGLPAIGRFAYGYDLGVLGFPLGLGIFAAIMGVFVVRAEWLGKGTPTEALTDEAEGLLENRDTLIQFGWLVGFVLLSLLLGFLIGPGLAILLYFLVDRRPWPVALLAGLATPAAIWVLFIAILKTPLPVMPFFLD